MPQFRRDAENFQRLDKGLTGIGFDNAQRESIYRTVAGIIHLGEVRFCTKQNAGGQDAPIISGKREEKCLQKGAELLGFPVEKLREVFLRRCVMIKRREQGQEKCESYVVERTEEQAGAPHLSASISPRNRQE